MRWLAAGIVAVVLGGLGTWALFTVVSDTRSAIKVIRTVYRGQPIDAQDLAVITVARTVDLAVVPGEQLNTVIGQSATTDLPAGGLLVGQSFGPPVLAPGVARVGVKIETGRLPSTPLHPGDQMLVVALPSGQTGGDLAASIDATLATAPAASADGSWTLDLNVPVSNAEHVARLAALKQVALVQKPGA